jgi:hypothetical protein
MLRGTTPKSKPERTMALDADDFAKRALDHGWNWSALHAAQRMQTFIFF